jgi:hypothetical protein
LAGTPHDDDLPRLGHETLYRGGILDLAEELDAAGLQPAATRLRETQRQCWTTSSEWLGETALALRAALEERDVPRETARRLKAVLKGIRKAMPPGFRV